MANPGRYFTNNAGKKANFIVTLHESGVDRIVFSSYLRGIRNTSNGAGERGCMD